MGSLPVAAAAKKPLLELSEISVLKYFQEIAETSLRASVLFCVLVFSRGIAFGQETSLQSPGDGSQSKVIAVQAVRDLGRGSNRFAFALLRNDGSEVVNAAVDVQFYLLDSKAAYPKSSAKATFYQMIVDSSQEREGEGKHHHEQTHSVYVVADVSFEKSGKWGAAITIQSPSEKQSQKIPLVFQVTDQSSTPALGTNVPQTLTPTARSLNDLRSICTRNPPDDMHHVSVDKALAARRPMVIVFASPSFCQGRLCGPLTDLVFSVQKKYGEKIDFIHIEPYDIQLMRNRDVLQLNPIAKQWGLPTEPWIFVADAHGMLTAKFEGVMGNEELTRAIEMIISDP